MHDDARLIHVYEGTLTWKRKYGYGSTRTTTLIHSGYSTHTHIFVVSETIPFEFCPIRILDSQPRQSHSVALHGPSADGISVAVWSLHWVVVTTLGSMAPNQLRPQQVLRGDPTP